MIEGLLGALAAWIIAVISAAGYAGIAGLMAIELACIPLPSEVIMPFAGYLASTGRFNLVLAATAGALGCNLGSTLAYAVGASGGRRAVEQWGRYVLLGPDELAQAERFFRRFGGLAVLIARLLPVVRTFIALPAGMARMPQLQFQLYTFAGSWPWCFALAYVGEELGERWNSDPALRAVMHRSDAIVLAVLVLAAGWFVWRKLRHRSGELPRSRGARGGPFGAGRVVRGGERCRAGAVPERRLARAGCTLRPERGGGRPVGQGADGRRRRRARLGQSRQEWDCRHHGSQADTSGDAHGKSPIHTDANAGLTVAVAARRRRSGPLPRLRPGGCRGEGRRVARREALRTRLVHLGIGIWRRRRDRRRLFGLMDQPRALPELAIPSFGAALLLPEMVGTLPDRAARDRP